MAKEYIEERDGAYYVAGTRISLDSIVHAFRRGESPETISQNFELQGKRNAEPLPDGLRERLARAREEMHTTRLA
jgi:hypothetical protein